MSWREEKPRRDIDFNVNGELFFARYDRTIFWPGTSTLIAADMHWGKDAFFRRRGVPLPEGRLDDELSQLSTSLQETNARRLLILGDLMHSRDGLTSRVIDKVLRWRETHLDVTLQLISGNHDRPELFPPEWGIQVLKPPYVEGSMAFVHVPREVDGCFTWAGHLRPTVRMQTLDGSARAPCFHIGRALGVLPAFSGFSGGPRINPLPGDRIYALVESNLIDVTMLLSPGSR